MGADVTLPERRNAVADWRHDAACLDIDPELFFPIGIDTVGDPNTAEAKAFCRVFCGVKDQCLNWALDRGIDDGVWGATTPRERRGILRARLDNAGGTCPKGHPWNGINVRHDRRGPQYCVACRRETAYKSHRTVARRKVLAEQFPPVEELVLELPGVRDRPRRRGREVAPC